MKCFAYCRVSTSTQENLRQRMQIEKYCKDTNIEIVEFFEEKISGTIEVRDALTSLLNEVKTVDVDYVIVSELSRLGRNNEVINTIKAFHKNKTGFISLKEGIKTDVKDIYGLTAADLLIGILSSINTFELSTFRYRSSLGLRKSIINGGVIGSLNFPFGYEKQDKKLVINETEAKVIRDIFRLYLEGNGTTSISNILNGRGEKTRSEIIIEKGQNKKPYNFRLSWVDGTIYSILKNPIYKGFRRYKGEIFEQNQLCIIDEKMFDEVQIRLKSNYNKADKHTNPEFNYIISKSKLFCGICGRTYFPHKRISGKDNRYICLSKRYKEPCENIGISIDKIEQLIQDVIFLIFSEKLINVLEDKNIIGKISTLEIGLNKIKNELEKLMKLESNVFNWQLSNKFNDKIIDDKLQEINANRKSLENKLIANEKELTELLNTRNTLRDIQSIKSNYKQGEKLPKQIIDKIITKIIITKYDNNTWKQIFPMNEKYIKGDKSVEVKIFVGSEILRFVVSQRTKLVFFIVEEIGSHLLLNNFFTGKFPEKAFNFISGR